MPKTQTERLWIGGAILVGRAAHGRRATSSASARSATTPQTSGTRSPPLRRRTSRCRCGSAPSRRRTASCRPTAPQLKRARTRAADLQRSAGLPAQPRSRWATPRSRRSPRLTVGAPTLVAAPDTVDAGSTATASDQNATVGSGTTAPATPTTPRDRRSTRCRSRRRSAGRSLSSRLPRPAPVRAAARGARQLDQRSGRRWPDGTTLDLALNAFVAPGSAAETEQLAQAAGQ